MNGSLGKKLITDLIRDIGTRNGSGLLRVSSGKSIKAIFFESGVPVYAISNVAREQVESILLSDGVASGEQIEKAKAAAGKAQKLGRALVEMGFVSEADITRVSLESARRIIFSLFELTRGDYIFDERVRAAAHEVKLDWTVSDCLLEGGRALAEEEEVATRLAPDDAVFVKPKSTGRLVLAGKLNPTESYIYSRIDTTIQINELAMSTGLPEEECRRAMVALISLGMVKVEGKTPDEDEAVDEDPADKIAEDVSRLIHFFSNADYYEVLGVTLRSSAGEIKSAYYQLAKKYHPDRFRQPEQAELRSKVEALFAKVTEAYETLSDTPKRALYDDRLRKGTTKRDQAPSMPIGPKVVPAGVHATAIPVQTRATGPLGANGSSMPPNSTSPVSSDSAGSESPSAVPEEPEPSVAKPAPAAPVAPGVSAEFCYQQGKARLEQKDYYGSVQLLREAVRLDSSKAPYHFHLGMALMRNPRNRKEGEQHLIRAAELDPFSAGIRIRLGLMYKEAGLAKKAESYFREALKIDPENRAALKELNGGGGKDDAPIWKADLGSLAKKIFKK